MEASTTNRKIEAYDKWLPLAILVHDSSANYYLNELAVLAKSEKNELAKGIYNLNMAYYVTENLGDYTSGLSYCITAKDIFEKISAKPQLVSTYNRLAFIVLWNEIARKKPVTASNIYTEYLAKALEISKSINDKNLQVLSLAFVGSYFIVTEKNNTKALEYFFDAERMMDSTIAPENRLVILESISIVYAEIGNEQKMLEYKNKAALEPFYEAYSYGRSNMFRSMSKFYLKNRNLDKALQYAEEAYNISVNQKAPEFVSRGAERLYEVYKAKGDNQKALYYFEITKANEDSLNRERFENAFGQYDVAKKESLIATQKLELVQKNIIVASIIGLALLIAWFFIYRFRKYRRKQQIQQQQALQLAEETRLLAIKNTQEEERRRMAADLHDNLGVQANAILHSTGRLKQAPEDVVDIADNLHDTAKEMLLNLRETLWAMKNNEVSAAELWIRAINFVKQVSAHYKHMQISISGNLPQQLKLDSPKALHVLMIVQEAINNAIKHANAANIEVLSSILANHAWQVEIKDNGKGFEQNEVSNKLESYGLSNMNERAKLAQVTVTINSIINIGTTVTLKV